MLKIIHLRRCGKLVLLPPLRRGEYEFVRIPLQITWRGIDPSEAVEARIRKLAERLEKFSAHIISCQVIVEAPHKHGHQGRLYEVHIHVTTPGGSAVAN